MADGTQKTLEKWIRQQILVADATGKVERFELTHVGLSKRASVGQFPVNGEPDYEDLSAEILSAAESDVEGLGGSQRYAVLAFRKGHPRPSARKAFRLYHESEDDSLGDTEEATPKGLMSQQMRHNEAIMRIGFSSQETIIRHYQRITEAQAERLNRLEDRALETVSTMERMLSEEASRKLEEKRYEADQENRAKMFQKLDVLLPVVANRIAGKQLLPADTGGAMVKGLVDSITPEQMNSLTSVFTPDQVIVFLELWQKHSPPKDEGGK